MKDYVNNRIILQAITELASDSQNHPIKKQIDWELRMRNTSLVVSVIPVSRMYLDRQSLAVLCVLRGHLERFQGRNLEDEEGGGGGERERETTGELQL